MNFINLTIQVLQIVIDIYHIFVGTGKSTLIRAFSLWAEKIFLKVGDCATKPRVLLIAFTGKAASLISK